MRLNLLLLSILLTGLSIAASEIEGGGLESGVFEGLWNIYTGLGLVFILISTAIAAVAYIGFNVRGGMSGRDIELLVENDFSPEANLQGIVEGYANWIQHNYKTNVKTAPLNTLMLLLLVYGIASLAIGVYHGIVRPAPEVAVLAVGIVLIIITWRTGLFGQVRRYQRYK